MNTLFKKTATGAIEQWRIWVEGNVILTEYGQVDGALQKTSELIATGKNLGRKNATTPKQQAQKEAEARWRKKIERNGYVESIERAMEGETDQEGGIAPMLAQPFEKHGDKLKYPIILQPKYNGVRCIAVCKNGKCTLWSRKRERIVTMGHIEALLERVAGPYPHIFDGELYRHGWSLQRIIGAVRRKEPSVDSAEIEYVLYDVPSMEDYDYNGRSDRLFKLLNSLTLAPSSKIRQTAERKVHSEEEAWETHNFYVQLGYEGAIGRNINSVYERGKRSQNLIKFKKFDENEFLIVGLTPGRGAYADINVLECQTDKGVKFFCNPPGSLAERRTVDATLIGKQLTVKHFGYTDDGVPAFPVGVAIRDYD